jgi:periplasmic divalent cation tolerance protein
MQRAPDFALVLVTAPNLKTARRLARLALESRLIACASLVPKLESHYWWQDKMVSSAEVLLLLKTRRARLKKLEALVLDHHPYDTPEFIALPLHSGTPRYLQWLARSCGGK